MTDLPQCDFISEALRVLPYGLHLEIRGTIEGGRCVTVVDDERPGFCVVAGFGSNINEALRDLLFSEKGRRIWGVDGVLEQAAAEERAHRRRRRPISRNRRYSHGPSGESA